MNVNHIYILIGVAALSALIATVVLYLMGTHNTAVVIGASVGSTVAVAYTMIRKNKEK